LAVDGDLDSI